jgi:hypothetical protein
MDIQLNTGNFKQFLVRCALGGIVRDLVIHTAPNNRIMGRVTDKMVTMFAEIYQDGVKVTEEGNIKVPNLQKLIAAVNRTDSEMLRIKSNADAFLLTDGTGVGKIHSNMAQTSDAEIVESYQAIEGVIDFFDKDNLTYNRGKIVYENGVELAIGSLQDVVDDAKAFSYDTYKMTPAKGMLKCRIENNSTGENFTRTIADKDFIGTLDNIPVTMVGMGFKEMIKAIKDSNPKDKVKLLIHDSAWLLTNGKDYFFNINTMEVE